MHPPTPANELMPDPRADAALGHCAWFVWDLRRSGLIPRERLDPFVNDFLRTNPDAEPPDLAAFLVQQGVLTNLQSERLLQGKTDGFVLGPYTLTDVLGAGSMGTVYKAKSKTDDRWYALKVLPRRSLWNVRLARRWVKSFSQCRHPSVVAFIDVGTSGGLHYLAWPFVEGRSLDRATAVKGKLPHGQAALIGMQAAEALHASHELGLYHGLLKPSNVLIDTDGRLRILDCGIGCLLGHGPDESMVDTMSTANAIVAGLDCASPERIADPKDVTPAGDQYSLGCVLYFLLTGGYPFPGKAAVEKMVGHQLKKATPVRELAPEVPEGLAEVVAKLMEKDPAARYASCADVAAALKPFAELPKRRVTRPVPTLKNLKATAAAPAAPAAARAEPPQPPSARAAEAARPAPEEPRPAPAPEQVAAPSLAAWLGALPAGLAVRVLASLGFLAAAALVLLGSRQGWFTFTGEHVRWLPKAAVSALVTGGVLTLMMPARKRSGA